MEAPRSSVQEHLSAPLCTTRTQVYVFCSLLLGLKQKTRNPHDLLAPISQVGLHQICFQPLLLLFALMLCIGPLVPLFAWPFFLPQPSAAAHHIWE